MKVYECIEQLDRIMKKYDKLADINRKLTYKIPYKTDEFYAGDIKDMINQIMKSFDYIPRDLSNQIKSYFDFSNIINSETKYLKENISTIKNLLKPSLTDKLYNGLSHLIIIENEKDCLCKINSLLDFIQEYIMEPYDSKYINLKDIFKNCWKSKIILVEYMNSLEVPTVPDYEVKYYKEDFIMDNLKMEILF